MSRVASQIERAFLALTAAISCVSASLAQPAEPSDTQLVQRPKIGFLRFNEDWSALHDVNLESTGDWTDRLKYISIDDEHGMWMSIGGHMRARFESWNNFGFGAPAVDDDSFLLWRATLHADVHFSDSVRVFIEGKSALSTDRDLPGGRRTLDVDSFALEQAFADLTIDAGDSDSVTFRLGRQVFLFGKQRLVSPLPWSNTMRRWDGVSAIVQVGTWSTTAFWSQFAPVREYDFNQADAQTQFFGVYATGPLGDVGINADAYFLGLDRDDPVTFNGTTGAEQRYTIGGRLFGKLGDSSFDYDLEGAWQFGEVGSGDVSAYMIAAQLGYTLPNAAGSPRIFLGFDYASGDDGTGGDVETFNQIFPLAHAYYGYADVVGRQNAIDFSVGATASPIEKLTLGLSGHFLYLADENDALYNAGGGVSRPGLPGASRDIGIEIDLTAKYAFDRHWSGLLGYSHVFAGDFIDDTGSSSDIDFVYVQLQYAF